MGRLLRARTAMPVALGLLAVAVGSLWVAPARGQSVAEDLSQPVALSVSGDSDLVASVRQSMQIYLIGAEARLVEEDAAWFVDVVVTETAGGDMVGLSLLASQPLPPMPAESPQLGEQEMTSGTWLLKVLDADRMQSARYIQQHELVVVAPHEVERGVEELVERFQSECLNFIGERVRERQ